MYTRVQKDSSAVSHSSLQKKSENLVSPRNFSVQTKPDTESLQKQEMPSYSRAAADSLYSNVMRSMEGTGHSQEIGIQRKCSECAKEEKDSDEISSAVGVQAKLTVGAVGDKYEQEADRVAAQVMSMPAAPNNSPQVQRFGQEDNPVQRWSLAQSITPHVQRQVDEQVQMRSLVQRAFQTGGNQASGDLESRLNASKGGGSVLAPEVRAFMEPRFGADFSGVRVHTGSEAVQMNRELGAQAFAHGSDIYFGAGKAPAKDALTAHELTHVVQQTEMVQLQKKPPASLGDKIREKLEISVTIKDKGLLAIIQSASVSERQAVLNDQGLRDLINSRLSKEWATIVMSSLLEGSQEWKNPSNNDFYRYFVLSNGKGTLPNTATMNCWESIMYAAYLANQVTADWIKKFYENAGSSADPNATVWSTLGWSTSLPKYPKTTPSAGQLLFYHTGGSVPGHVAVSLGGDQAISLWNQPNNIDAVQRIKVIDLSGTVYIGNPPW